MRLTDRALVAQGGSKKPEPLILRVKSCPCPNCGIPTARIGSVNIGLNETKRIYYLLSIAACDLCASWGEAKSECTVEACKFSLTSILETLEGHALNALKETTNRGFYGEVWPDKVKRKLMEAWKLLDDSQAKKAP